MLKSWCYKKVWLSCGQKIKSYLEICAADQCWVWRGTLGPVRACGGAQYGIGCCSCPCLVQSKPVGEHRVTYMVINISNDTAEGLDISGLCGNSLC